MNSKQETILILDDEAINRAILANIFNDEYRILEAEDGLEGLDVLQRYPGTIRAIPPLCPLSPPDWALA